MRIIADGPGAIIGAKLCFEDLTETPGPPKLPVCFDEGDRISPPAYPEAGVILYLETIPVTTDDAGKIGLETAVYSLGVVAGVK